MATTHRETSGDGSFPSDEVTLPLLLNMNPNHLRYMDSDRHGYVLADITPERARVEMRSPVTITRAVSATEVLARFEVPPGRAAHPEPLGQSAA